MSDDVKVKQQFECFFLLYKSCVLINHNYGL